MNHLYFLPGKDPVPIRCPVAGAFNFTQEGDFKFITRYIGGITKDPRHDVWGRTGQFSCKQNISRMAICGNELIYKQNFFNLMRRDWEFFIIAWLHRHWSKGSYNWWDILLVNRSPRSSNWYLQRPRLQVAVHWILEGEPQILSYNLWSAWCIYKIQMLGNFLLNT